MCVGVGDQIYPLATCIYDDCYNSFMHVQECWVLAYQPVV